jgi:sugar phosphate isomerase/epimerase
MLDPAQIYIVHINNAEDRPLSEMRQAHRTFCSLTGAIDLEGFLGALKAIGYIGSVSVEVFRPDLWEKPADVVINEAYRTTLDIMKSCGAVI